jgi:hypothetical protein
VWLLGVRGLLLFLNVGEVGCVLGDGQGELLGGYEVLILNKGREGKER